MLNILDVEKKALVLNNPIQIEVKSKTSYFLNFFAFIMTFSAWFD